MMDILNLSDDKIIDLLRGQMDRGIRIDHSIILHENFDLDNEREVDLFLKEFSSLLNSNGGTLIYGVGMSMEGICADPGMFLVKLKRILKKKIDPKVPEDHYSCRFIGLGDDRYILILNVPRSENRPHAVRSGENSFVFYKRDMDIHPLDMMAVRREILSSTNASDIRGYIQARTKEIKAGRGSLPLLETGKIMLNIVPGTKSNSGNRLDKGSLEQCFEDIDWTNNEWIETIEGFLAYYSNYSYIYIKHDLSLEAVESFKMKPKRDGSLIFNFIRYQKDIKELLSSFLLLAENVGADLSEYYFSISLIDMNGYLMELKMPGKSYRFDQDMLLPIRPLETNRDEIDIMRYINSYIDILWNLSG